jgi:hypothetical protein
VRVLLSWLARNPNMYPAINLASLTLYNKRTPIHESKEWADARTRCPLARRGSLPIACINQFNARNGGWCDPRHQLCNEQRVSSVRRAKWRARTPRAHERLRGRRHRLGTVRTVLMQRIERLACVCLKSRNAQQSQCFRVLSAGNMDSHHAVPTRLAHHASNETRTCRIIHGGKLNNRPVAVHFTFHSGKAI